MSLEELADSGDFQKTVSIYPGSASLQSLCLVSPRSGQGGGCVNASLEACLEDSAVGPRRPAVEVIVKLPHCRGRPGGQPPARRSVATVVQCCKVASGVRLCITLVHEGSPRGMLSGGNGALVPPSRDCFLWWPHGAYPRLDLLAVGLPLAAIGPNTPSKHSWPQSDHAHRANAYPNPFGRPAIPA
jgi:hypothetical protein